MRLSSMGRHGLGERRRRTHRDKVHAAGVLDLLGQLARLARVVDNVEVVAEPTSTMERSALEQRKTACLLRRQAGPTK